MIQIWPYHILHAIMHIYIYIYIYVCMENHETSRTVHRHDRLNASRSIHYHVVGPHDSRNAWDSTPGVSSIITAPAFIRIHIPSLVRIHPNISGWEWHVSGCHLPRRFSHVLLGGVSRQLPRSCDVVVEADLVDKCKPGDRIRTIGVFRAMASTTVRLIYL